MNSDRQQAYLNLISQLLNCDSGDEAEILKTHPELLDDGLVVAMLEEADNLREQGKLNNANWLKNFAGLLGKVDGDFLAGIALKAEADRLLEQGDRQYSISQFREALQSCEQALTIYREIGDREGEAGSLGNLGLVYNSLRQYDKAIAFYEQSLEIKREIRDRQGEANSLDNLGLAYKSLGQYHRAIAFYEQSLQIEREIGNRRGESASLGNLGNVYRLLSQYQKSIEFQEQSLDIDLEIGNRDGEANSLNNLGLAYNSLGQYHRAIEFYEESLDIDLEIGNRQGEANSFNNLGFAYESLGEYYKAIEFYEKSLEIKHEIGDSKGEAASICNLGLVYYSLGNTHKAIKLIEQSLKISRQIGSRQWESNSLASLGLAYASLGQLQRAIEFHQQSLEIEREIGSRHGEAVNLSNLGDIYYQISNGLRMRYKSIPKILAFILKKIFILLENHWLEQAELQLLASIAIHETLRSELVNNDHKASIFETQIFPYRLLQQVLVARSQFDEALEISEMSRTRAFVELLQQTLLTNELPTNNETNKLSIPKIQQIARDRNSTIVEYSIIDPDIIYIWVIQPNGNITHRAANLEPLNQQNQTLKQIILKTRVSIGTEETDDAGNKIKLESQYKRDETGRFPLLQLLHQILIEPIIDLLPTDANSPIIFIPHYDLFLVPFAALQDSNNRYLIEHHTILTSPSIQVLEITREHHNRVRGLRQAALIVGDPTIATKFNENPYKLRQIPRAKEAAEAIAATLGTQAISGDNATKVAILDRMLNTRIVHLSAHGLLDDFQSSGIPGAIILAPSGDDDGAIHAVDILQLKLDSELVVLSACSTGRGKITGDGVIGLSRCFILAGVPSIIVSLWNMGVISAKLLMTEFYQNLARGDNRAAALRCAMLTTKARFPSPIAWAAFTLIGETETLPLSTEKTDLRRLVMSLPDDAKPEEIVAAFSKLLKISEPQFVAELAAIDIGAMDNVNAIAERIKDWCESRPQIEENLENEIYQAGAGGTDSDAPEEVVREFYETLKENKIRLGLSRDSVAVEGPAPAVGEEGPGG
ncbi:MAG: CHAT domain-containing protein [Microcoleus sp. PH2017_25_DOB_D_A]|uniref:CHAT domain-containing protein n=1 Tax=unclassified Microcoleus TaxID=2642155 RepID=UPI001DDB4B86|nr:MULTISPECIES: CHAT domain-containing tetratricopeptide repeat protein [unclassified Microcoleus]TAE06345.1 MAG: CHAT domain-containing protein [Oscillatoriales cyanobacterium]MCC3494623.1 CHAT domain-containing protein [Microcoleus sp. PH2017_16_JOR_D_A]MCC3538355.1 CHAT domain-containing protein [Microcoleus sp. PH2017_25_DOB_D_A]MCC3550776.1 CHAT domain-containing protein [Microcoleus sp. PH2017_24_DOB_U_A]TAE29741.1 MAG: CHAT domain-containing protein [Oscillatoriales cyanobacterium]